LRYLSFIDPSTRIFIFRSRLLFALCFGFAQENISTARYAAAHCRSVKSTAKCDLVRMSSTMFFIMSLNFNIHADNASARRKHPRQCVCTWPVVISCLKGQYPYETSSTFSAALKVSAGHVTRAAAACSAT
jgi:hypothetical protein